MNSFETITIIIPCYNGELFVDRCLNSVYKQTYPNVEVIFIDDGSTDNSAVKIQQWSQQFSEENYKLFYYYKPNGGAASAISYGLQYVSGTYLMLLDIDDILMPDSLTKLSAPLRNNPSLQMTRCNGWYVNEGTTETITGKFASTSQEKDQTELFDNLIFAKTYNWPATYMVRTQALLFYYKTHIFYPSKYGQNLQVLLPMAYNSLCEYVDKPLMKYVLRPGSVSHPKTIEKKAEMLLGYKDIRLYLIDELIKSPIEKENYQNKIDIMYAKILFDLYEKEDIKNMQKQFFLLLKYHAVDWITLKTFLKYRFTFVDVLYNVLKNRREQI